MGKKPPLKTSEEAKRRAIECTAGRLTEAEARLRLDNAKAVLGTVTGVEDRKFWEEQVSGLQAWLQSDEIKNGAFSSGIDSLIIDLIEWRAMLHALTRVDLQQEPFQRYCFHQQWLVGAAYAVVSLFGKLASNVHKDVSLHRLWNEVSNFVRLDGAVEAAEHAEIRSRLSNLTAERSPAIRLRHKSVAHNESNPKVAWGDLDPDLKTLVRTWSVIVGWCSFGILEPFRSNAQAFSGLEGVCSDTELRDMYKRRSEFLEVVREWARHRLHDDSLDDRGHAFATLSVSIKQAPDGA